MTEYQAPSVNFRLSPEDKQLLRDLARLLQTSQVMAFRLVLREVVPALKAAKGKDIRRPAQSRPAN